MPAQSTHSLLIDIAPYVVSILTAIIASWSAYKIGKKKSQNSDFDLIIKANEKFRDEIRKDLKISKDEIEKLKTIVDSKDKEIGEMQTSIADLKQQLVIRETNISELTIQIMKRDLKIQELEDRMNNLTNSK